MKYYKIYALGAIACFFAACSGNQKPVDLTTPVIKKAANKYELANVTEKALSSTAKLLGQLQFRALLETKTYTNRKNADRHRNRGPFGYHCRRVHWQRHR